MENTALKMSAKELIAEFTELHGNTDLMKIAMITGSADTSRTYENLKNWAKNASGEEEKAMFNGALTALQNLTIKRIAITNIIYGGKLDEILISLSKSPVEETIKETAKTITTDAPIIAMVPSLEDTLERVRTLYKVLRANPDKTDKVKEETKAEAFEILKISVGQGKVLNTSGQPETWDNNKIYAFLNAFEEAPEKVADKFGFETIYGNFTAMIEAGKSESEIKDSLKELLMGKTISSKDSNGNTIIKDEKVFEDYYDRILKNLVIFGITAFTKKSAETVITGKIEEVTKQVEEEIKPFLIEQDKDVTLSSLSPITKRMAESYKSHGFNKSLKDLWFAARDLTEKYAPNLAKRNKESKKGDVLVNKTVEEKKMSTEGENIEIYDDSHNIKESNKELWAEVEKFAYLNELFTKAQELYKLKNWKDALSMSIILISSGQIKETVTSKEVIKWNTDQIKNWFHTIVEASVTGAPKETIDVVAIEVKDVKVPEVSEKTTGPESVKEIGPVAKVGQINDKEGIKKTLLDAVSTVWKEKYPFKVFKVKTDHHNGLTIDFEVTSATEEQEVDLFITEHNLCKFFDDQRDKLVAKRNEEKNIRKDVFEKLSLFYLITNSEVKRIITKLITEADIIRKEAKAAGTFKRKPEEDGKETTDSKSDVPATKPTDNDSGGTINTSGESIEKGSGTEDVKPIIEMEARIVEITEKVMNEPAIDNKEDVAVPPTQPAEAEKSETVKSSPEATTVIDKSAGEELSNSNKESEKLSYEGFENILKANKKLDFHLAIYNKVKEYPTSEEGLKAVFSIVNQARKDDHYKKSFIRNHMNAMPADLLLTINKAYTLGVEHAATKQ